MTQRNVRAVYVGDTDNGTESEVRAGRFQLAYLRPEALDAEQLFNKLHVQPA